MTLKDELKTKRKASKPEVKPRHENVDSFWASFYTKHPGTVYNVLPTKALAEKDNIKRAPVSYNEAALACKKAVEKIAMECRRLNQKYRDQDFDIESDLKDKKRDCLDAIDIKSEDKADPLSTKRVPVSCFHSCVSSFRVLTGSFNWVGYIHQSSILCQRCFS